MPGSLNILFLEPFYGGSHRDFADGFIRHTRHRVTLRTMPARFWKWRMRGAALHFAAEVPDPGRFDILLCSDLMSLSDLKSLWGRACPPAVVYFHENQLSYPLAPGERMDYQFGFTDITTALSADLLLFNSAFHRSAFIESLPGFIGKMPDNLPKWVAGEIGPKARVLHPGCGFPRPIPTAGLREPSAPRRARIAWNHRWEFDKRPEAFFGALSAVDDCGGDFDLVLLGENFKSVPREFTDAKARYGGRIVRYGRIESKAEYFSLLAGSDITVSTAGQENFGISVVEAVRMGCYPLLPARLSYPEVLPERYHSACLYNGDDELTSGLKALVLAVNSGEPGWYDPVRGLAEAMERYSWETVIGGYDEILEETAAAARG